VGTLRDGGLEIAADASRGSDVIEMISSHHPGFVVVGSVTDMPLVQLVRRVRAQPDAARVLVLLGRISPEAIAELLSLEVGGLMPRSIDGADLISAVQRVLQGERVVDPAILVNDAAVEEQPESASALTAREREVLVLLASGHSNREIASSLFVSLPTVKTHLAHIYAKLGAKNRNEALGRAVAGGLL
jgi:DNA-binding NarL/FixJ family response regulator